MSGRRRRNRRNKRRSKSNSSIPQSSTPSVEDDQQPLQGAVGQLSESSSSVPDSSIPSVEGDTQQLIPGGVCGFRQGYESRSPVKSKHKAVFEAEPCRELGATASSHSPFRQSSPRNRQVASTQNVACGFSQGHESTSAVKSKHKAVFEAEPCRELGATASTYSPFRQSPPRNRQVASTQKQETSPKSFTRLVSDSIKKRLSPKKKTKSSSVPYDFDELFAKNDRRAADEAESSSAAIPNPDRTPTAKDLLSVPDWGFASPSDITQLPRGPSPITKSPTRFHFECRCKDKANHDQDCPETGSKRSSAKPYSPNVSPGLQGRHVGYPQASDPIFEKCSNYKAGKDKSSPSKMNLITQKTGQLSLKETSLNLSCESSSLEKSDTESDTAQKPGVKFKTSTDSSATSKKNQSSDTSHTSSGKSRTQTSESGIQLSTPTDFDSLEVISWDTEGVVISTEDQATSRGDENRLQFFEGIKDRLLVPSNETPRKRATSLSSYFGEFFDKIKADIDLPFGKKDRHHEPDWSPNCSCGSKYFHKIGCERFVASINTGKSKKCRPAAIRGPETNFLSPTTSPRSSKRSRSCSGGRSGSDQTRQAAARRSDSNVSPRSKPSSGERSRSHQRQEAATRRSDINVSPRSRPSSGERRSDINVSPRSRPSSGERSRSHQRQEAAARRSDSNVSPRSRPSSGERSDINVSPRSRLDVTKRKDYYEK